jgi:CRP/FNR family cyclic AMP-dependent transcriptional regulator
MIPSSLLKEIYFFSNFSDDEIGLIQEISDCKKYGPKDPVFEEGREAGRLFFVVSGALAVQKNGKEIAELGQGETFGEMPFLDGGTRSASILAKEAAELVEISYNKLSTILLNNPEMALKFYMLFSKHVSRRLRATTSDYQKATQILHKHF